ncbi:class I SAM-dependent methyltransferase [bacterium]|nr:class I SAM-dependent methyltransferase [bacterium]
MNRIEEHQEDTICDIESAEEYFNSVIKKSKLYHPIIHYIKRLNIHGKYLELGSGPCVLTALLAESIPDIHISAMDISPYMTEIAKRYIEQKQLNHRILPFTGDPEDIQTLDGLESYDLVYSTYSMHHWKDAQNILKNIYQRVRIDGKLVIVDLKRVWWLYYLPMKNHWFTSSIRASYSSKEIRKIMNQLKINHYQIENFFPFSRMIIIDK